MKSSNPMKMTKELLGEIFNERPKTLGEIRKKLHKEAERRLVCEIPKEMTGRPIPDIEALLVSETKAEAPAPFSGNKWVTAASRATAASNRLRWHWAGSRS